MPDMRTQHELAEIKHIHERYERDYRAYVLKLKQTCAGSGALPVWR